MTLWLVRGGRQGQHIQRFLDENRIYLTWSRLNRDLSKLASRTELIEMLQGIYPDASLGRVRQNSVQIWAFAREMQPGDWVALPFKGKPAINIAEIKGAYAFLPNGDDPFFHYRKVEWLARDIPRSNFSEDILNSLGAFTTICRIERNDAEARVRAMAGNNWTSMPAVTDTAAQDDAADASADLELRARDQIARLIISKYSGYELARLVDAVLQAQGYTTYLSPPGPDKGVDILAAAGPLGFGRPRICVQVKSGESPVDRPTLDQLIGTMQNVQADQGLLVSWGGFRSSIDREKATQFFRVRLWDQGALLNEIFSHYSRLPEEIRLEVPLKQIWAVAAEDQED